MKSASGYPPTQWGSHVDEVIKVISPPPGTLGNYVARMALHPPTPQPKRVHHLPGLQAWLPEHPSHQGRGLCKAIFQQVCMLVRRVGRGINGTISEGADRQTDGRAHHRSQSPSQPPRPSSRSCNTLQWRDRKGKDPAELLVSASLQFSFLDLIYLLGVLQTLLSV